MYQTTEIEIPIDGIFLGGSLTLPDNPRGIVIFAHGSGSSRFSKRNQAVADHFNGMGFGTLLFDLLTRYEEAIDDLTRELRFNIPLLAKRLVETTTWFRESRSGDNCQIGYFGASTGAAAALIAAAELGRSIGAVVSRGGRPDLAIGLLSKVTAPTLLIVGEYDNAVIKMNEQAMKELLCEKQLAIVPRATHLFEEPGALESVAVLAADWFAAHLQPISISLGASI